MSEVHSFYVHVAEDVGVNAAVILGHIKWWCKKNRANGKHFHDGLYWTYNSSKALKEIYPYMSEHAIRTALSKLEDRGYIKTGVYNKVAYDRTKWYAITEEGLALFGESICHFRKMEDAETANGTDESEEPIPVSNRSSSVSNHTPLSEGQLTLFDGGQSEPSSEDVRKAEIDEIVDYFYEVTKRKRRGNQSAFRKKLNARLNDGNSVDDIKSAIRKKHADVVGTKWESRCMSPSWLFDPGHFEDALNLPEPSQHVKKDGGARNAEYVRYTN